MISVIYCTRKSDYKHESHIRKSSGINKGLEVIEIVNNGEDLTKCYNRGLKQAKNDIVVFCHDDIFFNKDGWGKKLIKQFDETDFGIIGIAGTTNLPESGRWWTDATKMVGIVKHSHEGKTWESKYSGNFPKRVIETVTVDGLFFAVHKDRIKEEFDESVGGFHFYEIDFCFRNRLADVKVGVSFDIKVTHKSVGQTNEQWEENRKLFIEKFKDNLPYNIEVKADIEQFEVKIKDTPKLKVLISTNGDTKKLINLCKQIKDSGYENHVIDVVVNKDHLEIYEGLEIDDVTFHEGVYNSINKNLSILKWDSDFISEKDELVCFMSDNIILENDVINKFVKTYLKTKRQFGVIFPRILNKDNTILSCGIVNTVIEVEGKTNARYNLKGQDSYYNYSKGTLIEDYGNVGLCFMTTFKNLEDCGWFRLDLEKMFYETVFSLTCASKNMRVFVDNDCVVRVTDNFVNGVEDEKQLGEDYQKFLNVFNEDAKLLKFLKIKKQ